jgi:transposase
MRSKTASRDMPALRAQVIELSRNGVHNSEISRRCRVARSSVIRWLGQSERQNESALKLPMGRPPRLSDGDRVLIVDALLKGASANGFDTPLWTLDRVAEVIRRMSGVSYARSSVSNLLHNLGWSCQKPERKAKERDEEAIAGWKADQWPQIKKKHQTWTQ